MNQEIHTLKQLCRSPITSLRKTTTKRRISNRRRLTLDISPFVEPEEISNNSPVHKDIPLEQNQEINSSYRPLDGDTRLPEQGYIDTPLDSNGEIKISSTDEKPKIFIFGDQQVKGLASIIIKARSNRWNDKYNVESIIKPNATSTQILSSCSDAFINRLTSNDIILLALGSNDKCPYTLISEICNVLYKLRHNYVYITK